MLSDEMWTLLAGLNSPVSVICRNEKGQDRTDTSAGSKRLLANDAESSI